MSQNPKPVDVVVAGHICIDIIPTFKAPPVEGTGVRLRLEELLTPGKLVDVGPAVISTGGAVSNTGLALHRLGVPVRLVGKLGKDQFGQMVLQLLERTDPGLTQGMVVARQEASSYTFVINPPGVDRIFLHCPGANDTFGEADVQPEHLQQARLFHFGYPPLVRQMYLDGGSQLEALFRKVKAAGLVTSLDMARPDPASEAGQVDWNAILTRVLPWVDIFLPSLDEMLLTLDRPLFDHLQAAGDETQPGGWLGGLDARLLSDLGARLIGMGAAVVGLKLGDQGLYVRTSPDPLRLKSLCERLNLNLESWLGRECLSPSFRSNHFVGATGAGDCAIAGFLTGALAGLPLEATMTGSVATGACNVEAADATSGVPTWKAVQQRIQAGWERLPVYLDMHGWQYDEALGVWQLSNQVIRQRGN